MMATEADEEMRKSMEFTLKLARDILKSCDDDPKKALLNAAGTMAQVIHLLTADTQREGTLQGMSVVLQNYLKLLDEFRGPNASPG